MDRNTIFRALALAGVTAALAGCAGTMTPNLDQRFGESTRAALSSQNANPQAPVAKATVAGLGGEAAAATVDRYNRTFKQPPPQVNVFSIGVGSGSGSMTATGSGASAER